MTQKFMQMRLSALLGLLAGFLAAAAPARADTTTECTLDKFCYCVDVGLKGVIDSQVAAVRDTLGKQKALGKAIGYMSIPISTIAGSYYGVNVKVGTEVKERVESRFGSNDAWILNPGDVQAALPSSASGADYMLMWTKVLEGRTGLGEDFDFVYFVGPFEFARHFSLDGRADMEKLDAYYDGAVKTDPGLAKIDKKSFREYYALRASVAFSLGSHDEWNIVRAINEARRSSKDYGLAKQLGVFFDGRPVAPGLFETPIAAGDAGACGK
ncbi:MAG TPA: hypothetical protein VK456_16445 [Xanthobacteraceae bacterium]|nr:hypothetical protein [Xanthobacteraceae bacterium]